MISYLEIENWLDEVRPIIIDLNISIQNSKRLTEDKYEFENEIKDHGFFEHYRYQQKFIIVIQLCKILSKGSNEKMSFIKLFNRLENERYESDLEAFLNNNNLESTTLYTSKISLKRYIGNLKNKINLLSPIIDKVVQARNKVYAHKDPNANVQLVDFNELETLIKLSSEIFYELEDGLIFKTTCFDELDDWSIDRVLWYMAKVKENDAKERKSILK